MSRPHSTTDVGSPKQVKARQEQPLLNTVAFLKLVVTTTASRKENITIDTIKYTSLFTYF